MEETTAPQKSKKPKKLPAPAINAAIIATAFVAILAIIIVLLNGQTTVTTSKAVSEKDEAISCSATSATYSKLTPSTASRHQLDYNLVFANDEIATIGMTYTMYYNSAESASRDTSALLAEFNKNLATSGYKDVDTFANHLSEVGDRLIFTLYVRANELNGRSAPYFMILTDDTGKIIPETKSDYIKNYENQGFSCKETN